MASPPVVAADALATGFRVPEFSLTRAEAGFTAAKPEGAERLVCGVFVCEPEFFVDAGGGAGESDVVRLVNLVRCVPRSQTFTVGTSGKSEVAFVLGDLEPTVRRDCAPALGLTDEEAEGPSGYPVVEMLHVGCWAIGHSRVVAATRLVPLQVTEMPDAGRVLRLDCQGAANGSWCRVPGDIGLCVAGECDFSLTPTVLAPPVTGEGGAASASPTASEAVTDCDGIDTELEVTCRRELATAVGQCLSGTCVVKTGDTYRRPLAIEDCSAEGFDTDWLNCYPSPTFGFGTCLDHACRLRCRDDDDCRNAIRTANVDSDDTRCERPRWSYLGLCRGAEEEQATEGGGT